MPTNGTRAGAEAALLQKTTPLLSVDALHVRFGGIVALDGVSFKVGADAIVGLIGPNGAGKTTLFNCLSRLYTPDSGSILFEGRSILDRPAHRMAEIGFGRTFQNLALFQSLSVLDNVLIGAHVRSRSDVLSDALVLPWTRRGAARLNELASEIIDYLGLTDVSHRPVGNLPFGTQKRVELARALATSPKLLLLDEPACGLNHEEVMELGEVIRRLSVDRGCAVLIVEHHVGLVMALCDAVVVLNFGRKIADGAPASIRNDPEVIRAYLGPA